MPEDEVVATWRRVVGLAKAIRKIRWKTVRGGPGRRTRVLTVATENGLLSFSNMDAVVGKGLYISRSWEIALMTESLAYLRQEGYLVPAPGDVMLDVGANIGMICIAMLKRGHFRHALAFEPCSDTCALLERNIRQNGMQAAIRLYPCALSDASQEMALELSADNFGDHRLRVSGVSIPGPLGEGQRRTVRVPLRTLDEVLDDEDAVAPNRIGLIWVDIQGHEGQFFAGARKTLAWGMPVVSEFWPYGIRRAGHTPESFTEIVGSIFTHVVHVDLQRSRFQRLEIGALKELFDAFPGPDDFQEMIFLTNRAQVIG